MASEAQEAWPSFPPVDQGQLAGSRGSRGLELTRHAAAKLETYGIEAERLSSWLEALEGAEPFWDETSGARGLVMSWEGRPWVVTLSEDGDRVITIYPTKARTVINRRGGGRWIFPSN